MEEKVEIAKEVAKQIDSIAGIACANGVNPSDGN